jgi:phosphoenolpyruvate carboxylase
LSKEQGAEIRQRIEEEIREEIIPQVRQKQHLLLNKKQLQLGVKLRAILSLPVKLWKMNV